MKNKYDVICIGSGPSSLGFMFRFIEKNKNLSALMIDKSYLSSGGLRNDGKMNFAGLKIGFPNNGYWNEEQANYYLNETEKYLKPKFIEIGKVDSYIERAKKYGAELIIAKQSHIGTDKSPELINSLINKLKDNGVDVVLGREMIDIDYDNKAIILEDNSKIFFEKLILGLGRKGATFFQKLMSKLDVKFIDNIVDIGIRLEMREENYKIVRDIYDPKIYINDVRTFCSNSGAAYVTKEKYKDFYSVNGHAFSKDKKPNGLVNFALLKTIKLTEPITSGNEYAKIVGKMAMNVGGGQPIMQRIGDFRAGKRSKIETFNNDLYDFEPTLKGVTAGDISLACPSKILRSIWESMKVLDSIIPGCLYPSNIMYFPEIKKYMNNPQFIDDHFQIKKDIYAIGDVVSHRGITSSFASGIRCLDGILDE
ncbi:MAG: hypothetical protein M0Q13_13625 [Methanothrix sp.]|jgi:hypothetical protein|nr:hypothetical protein [Methanothrix sp.]